MDLSLLEILFTILLINTGPVTSLENLAAGKTVEQSVSEEGPTLSAGNAIDGLPVTCAPGNYVNNDGGYSYTKAPDPWWRIDLGSAYFITSVSICYNGHIESLYLLSDGNNDQFPSAPAVPSTNWTQHDVITESSNFVNVNNLPLFEARHLALYKNGYQNISIREIWINGYTQADLDGVEIDDQSFPSTYSIDFTINVRNLNLELFGNVRMWLYRDMREVSSVLVTSTPFQWNTTDSNLLSDYRYYYKIDFTIEDEVTSRNISGLEKAFNASTLCSPPSSIGTAALSELALIELANGAEYEGQRFIRAKLHFLHPSSGCRDSDLTTLKYSVTTIPAAPHLQYSVHADGRSLKILRLTGLQPYTNYTLTMNATNIDGFTNTSNASYIQTIEGEPWDGPEDISLDALNQSCARLSWSKPPLRPNGIVLGYRIKCTDIDRRNIAPDLPVGKDYCDRSAGSKFACTVSAFTRTYYSHHGGYLGRPTDVSTILDQEEPVASAYALNSSCIKLRYEILPYVNDEILKGYQINCSYKETTNHTVQPMSSSSYIWCSLPPATAVVCTLAEQYASGTTGGKVKVNTTTLFHLDVTSVDNEEITEGSDGVYNVPLPVINLDPSQGEIKDYLVILYSADSATKRKRSTSECPYNIDKERAQPPTFDPQLPYTEAKKCQLDYYLSARLNVTVVEPGYRFPVGDGKVYGGVHNVPLEKGISYGVYYGVNATVQGETAVVVHILEEGAGTITVPGNEKQSGLNGGQVAGLIVGVCVFAAIVVVAVILIVRWKRKQESPSANIRTTPSTSPEVRYTKGPV